MDQKRTRRRFPVRHGHQAHSSANSDSFEGNHILSIVEGKENLRALGTKCFWEGAQDIVLQLADE
jgi:hypothetical protein